ncbi:restriction endonuclease subunit S [Rosistilla oblonga]|uniref:restriction endonuclease subunit S n=1 Tax=Rosistilla oblonga TaxID=2527990 RepID=UPI003A97D891
MSDENGELPDGWAWASFDDVTLLMRNGTTERQNQDGRGVAVSRIETIATGEIDFNKVGYIADSSVELVEKYRLRPGDILLSHINSAAHLGKTAVYRSGFATLLHGMNLMLLRLDTDAVEPELFHRFCNFHRANGDFSLIAQHAVNQASINQKKLKSIQLPLPPLPEQRRIVSKIEALQERSGKAREALAEVGPLLEQFRQSLLAAAFRGDLTADWRAANPDVEPASELLQRIRQERRERWEQTELAKYEAKGKQPPKGWKDKYKEPAPVDKSNLPELPNGWCWASVGEAFEVFVGATPSRKDVHFWHGNVPWVSSGEVCFCRISDTKEKITALGLASTSTNVHPPGTVLLGMIGEGKTRGQAAILDISACHNQNSAAIRVADTAVPPEYIYQYFRFVYESTRRVGAGNNQPALNKSRVQSMTFPLAPIGELVCICEEVSQLLASASDTMELASTSRNALADLDQSILAKAFRGELVPQDPDDEPASALLRRIREQREAAADARKKVSKKKTPRKCKARSDA